MIRERHHYLDELAQAISDPDEIWLEYNSNRKQLVKKMMRFYRVKNAIISTVALFSYEKNKTQGVSVHLTQSTSTTQRKRSEKLIYAKK